MLKKLVRMFGFLSIGILLMSQNCSGVSTSPIPVQVSSNTEGTQAAASVGGNRYVALFDTNNVLQAEITPFEATVSHSLGPITNSSISYNTSIPIQIGADTSGNVVVIAAQTGNLPPKAFLYTNTNATWSDITAAGAGLATPTTPVNAVAFALTQDGAGLLVYTCNTGAYAYFYQTSDISSGWTKFNGNAPFLLGSNSNPAVSILESGPGLLIVEQAGSLYGFKYDASSESFFGQVSPSPVVTGPVTTYDAQATSASGQQVFGTICYYQPGGGGGTFYTSGDAFSTPALIAPSLGAAAATYLVQATDPGSGNTLLAIVIGTDIYATVLPFGGTWTTPVLLSSSFNVAGGKPVVGATSGLGGIAWSDGTSPNTSIKAAYFPMLGQGGGDYATPPGIYTVATGADLVGLVGSVEFSPVVGSPYSYAYLTYYNINGANATIEGSLFGLPVGGGNGPTNLTAKKVKNKFLTQTDYVAVLKWEAPTSGTPASYNIYKNGVLIANVPGSQLKYNVHNLKNNTSYVLGVAAVSSTGTVSSITNVTVKFRKKK